MPTISGAFRRPQERSRARRGGCVGLGQLTVTGPYFFRVNFPLTLPLGSRLGINKVSFLSQMVIK